MATELTIAAVLEHYDSSVRLPYNQNWRPIRCPFKDNHKRGDRTLSASVSLGKNAFRCHACGAAGNPITLIMQQERLDYRDAVAFAEAIFGEGVVPVSRSARGRPAKRQPSRWRQRLFPESRSDEADNGQV